MQLTLQFDHFVFELRDGTDPVQVCQLESSDQLLKNGPYGKSGLIIRGEGRYIYKWFEDHSVMF